MSKTMQERLLQAKPGLREAYDKNAAKRELALAMRTMRLTAGLSQVQLAEQSGLGQSHISRIESATGAIPTTESIMRYAAACNARTRIEFVPADQPADEVSNAYISMASLP